jgi:hypothetical protein
MIMNFITNYDKIFKQLQTLNEMNIKTKNL